ncbi:PAS domain-containing protein [Rhizobium sp. G21]|uniref:PAS domain-containing protein n=1 Tax=Rhizobium sp. G21 TaxID=2758439 RepID=UPI00160397D2|nr:PAS domain-containing protein [Rhizobium sp. G21]MBB1248892.1 PAS domain-containing protein [Rhizobium sp. G21]
MRLTEEILDALPIGVAVKDRNLNYAAINKRFSELFDLRPERLIGRSVWDVFEPGIAGALEEANWKLLSSGEDQKTLVEIRGEDEAFTRILHRSRRIGRPGAHYIVMTFETTTEPEVDPAMIADASAVLDRARDMTDLGSAKGDQLLRVALATTRSVDERRLVAGASDIGVELCVIRSPTELDKFLPALDEAGVQLDLILLDESAVQFAPIAAKGKTPVRVLSSVSALLSDLALFIAARERRQDEEQGDVTAQGLLDQPVDVLALEDREVNRLALAQILDSLGLTYVLAETGQAALDLLAQRKIRAGSRRHHAARHERCGLHEKGARASGRNTVSRHDAAVVGETVDELLAAGFLDMAVKPISSESIGLLLQRHYSPRIWPEKEPAKTPIHARSTG